MSRAASAAVPVGLLPDGQLPLPWLAEPAARAAALGQAHAVLIHGPAGAGHLALGLLLAQARLCEQPPPAGLSASTKAAGGMSVRPSVRRTFANDSAFVCLSVKIRLFLIPPLQRVRPSPVHTSRCVEIWREERVKSTCFAMHGRPWPCHGHAMTMMMWPSSSLLSKSPSKQPPTR